MPDLQTLEPQESWANRELRFWQVRESARVGVEERGQLLSEIPGRPGFGEADQLGCGVIGKTREAWGVK